ncbi:MAG: carbohydrate kinase family protein [Candidatus Colwellbacteria bacterium]|nr:carbohydrate kinase family protein [Candidatus Colwellbacteria bacterium]
MKFDVVAIGSTTRDVFLKTNFKSIPFPKTPTGRAFVVPAGEKIGVDDVYFTVGGNAANATVTFSRQGYKAAVLTRIGDDAEGVEVKKKLRQEGISTDFISAVSIPTAFSVLLLQAGERTILSYHGAMESFSLKSVDWGKLKSKWWYVSLPGESYKLLGQLLKAARENNVSVALNPSFKHLLQGKEELIKCLKDISLLVLNEGEAAALTNTSFKKPKHVFRKLDELTPGVVVVTSGAKGAVVSDGRFVYKAGTFKERKLVDRTGAGDAYGSGFVAGLIRVGETCKVKGVCDPRNIEYAIRLASANATSVVEKLGATEGTLTKKEFDNSPRFRNLAIVRRKIF